MGLSVPRPPVQLVQLKPEALSGPHEKIIMRGRDDPELDVTDLMHSYCKRKLPQLDSIHGYIFKSRSPSCGVTDTPLFNTEGEQLRLGSGLFVQALLQQYPELPITDEQGLQTPRQQQAFLKQVLDYSSRS